MDWDRSGRCRVCGCTDDRACYDGCSWVEDDLCSTCAPYLNIPQELREMNRRIAWDLNKKYPIELHMGGVANWSKSDTWGTFEEAVSFANSKSELGIAMVLPEQIYAVDIDTNVIFSTQAFEIIDIMQSYTELSPGGIHIICRGDLSPEYAENMEFIQHGKGYELICSKRLLAFTGQQICDYQLSNGMDQKIMAIQKNRQTQNI